MAKILSITPLTANVHQRYSVTILYNNIERSFFANGINQIFEKVQFYDKLATHAEIKEDLLLNYLGLLPWDKNGNVIWCGSVVVPVETMNDYINYRRLLVECKNGEYCVGNRTLESYRSNKNFHSVELFG